MRPSFDEQRAGARNLLINCAGVKSGDTVLVVREEFGLGYYDEAVADRVEEEARSLGAIVHSLRAPRINGPEDFPDIVTGAMQHADHTIFFTRIADQMRFVSLPGTGTKTMCYALGLDYLGSEACTIPYALTVEVLEKLQAELDRATEWRVTCPLGTDVAGRCDPTKDGLREKPKFTLRLFPVGAFRPFSCGLMNGRLVTKWFPPIFTHRYEPFGLMLDEPVELNVEQGRICGIDGNSKLVAKLRDHYERIGSLFGDPYRITSWHGGTNPKIFAPFAARDDIERWGGTMHAHPRYTHFHSCGDMPPGEISIVTIDPTIYVDDVMYWKDGRLLFLEREDVLALRAKYPDTDNAFEMRMDIGIV